MPEGATTPESLTLTLPAGVRVRAIGLTAGYTKETASRDLFTGNRRIETVVIRHGDERWEGALDVEDRALQDIPVDGGGGEWIVELREWVEGDRPDWREMAVSELRVLGELGDAQPTKALAPSEDLLRERAEQVLGRYHRDLGAEATAFERRALGALAMPPVVVGLHDDPSVPLTLPGGRCHAVVVHATRRVPGSDTVVLGLGEASAPDTWDRYGAGDAAGTAVFGLDPVICPASDLAVSLTLVDAVGVHATIAVFAQDVDPEAMDGEASLLPLGEELPPAPTMARREGRRLTRLFLTADVFGREPGEEQRVYAKGVEERAYCYFELANPAAEATTLTLGWENEAGESRREPTEITVPAQRRFVHYRYTTLASRRPGSYRCVVRDAEGEELGNAPFRLLAP